MVQSGNTGIRYAYADEFGDRFRGKRVLVTGATGFVGQNLADALLALGADLIAAALEVDPGQEEARFPVIQVDMAEPDSARKLVAVSRPEYVFHLAGLVDTRRETDLVIPTIRANLIGTVNLLTALAGTQCDRVLVVTSSETPHASEPPSSPYAASKLAMAAYAEMYFALYALPVVIARPHMVYGPHQPATKLIPYVIQCGFDGVPPQLTSGKRICDLVFVKDFVRAMLLMAVASGIDGQIIDVGTGSGTSIAEVALRIRSLMGSPIEPVLGALPDRPGEVPQVADRQHAEELLGWRPLWTLDQGLIETLHWYKGEHSINASWGEKQRSRTRA